MFNGISFNNPTQCASCLRVSILVAVFLGRWNGLGTPFPSVTVCHFFLYFSFNSSTPPPSIFLHSPTYFSWFFKTIIQRARRFKKKRKRMLATVMGIFRRHLKGVTLVLIRIIHDLRRIILLIKEVSLNNLI